jgi:hypothetical protein
MGLVAVLVRLVKLANTLLYYSVDWGWLCLCHRVMLFCYSPMQSSATNEIFAFPICPLFRVSVCSQVLDRNLVA